MVQSQIIEIDGRFVGAAVRQMGGWRFVAVDVRLDGIDGRVMPSVAAISELARATASGPSLRAVH